ncbi:MAG TPA: alpha/beta hydrolase [Gemmatimonadaceae bacterium]|nr:alpha/beta hydrolase [Gemmatimonadaceae bacterium]
MRVTLDIAYARRGERTLRLDLARPAVAPPAPLVVLLHGGGWEGGSRASLRSEMEALARLGYAAATVEYRLTERGRNLFPAAIADARCAVRFLRANAARLGIDGARIGAAGYSAGAHLASLLGTAATEAALDEPCGDPALEDVDPRVQAVISHAGPQDLRVRGPYTAEQARLVTNFLGVFPGDDPARAALASPLAHVSPGDAPMLLVAGTRDDLVPVDHARWMADALREVGVEVTVLERRGAGHEFAGFVTGDREVRAAVLRLLERELQRR